MNLDKRLLGALLAGAVTIASAFFALGAVMSSAGGRPAPAPEASSEPDVATAVDEPEPGEPESPEASEAEVAISIDKFAFDPAEVEVTIGSSVTWTNDESVTHNVFTEDGKLASEDLGQGDSYTVTLDEPGEVMYYCDIHQYMRATLTVVP